MNILVTGANGQLGNCMRRSSRNSADNYIFTGVAELDITDAAAVDAIVRSHNVDLVINCAAYTNVDKAEDDHKLAELLNATAVRNLADAIRANNGTLIHVSTELCVQWFDGQHPPQRDGADESDRGVWRDETPRRTTDCRIRREGTYIPNGMAVLRVREELRQDYAQPNIIETRD